MSSYRNEAMKPHLLQIIEYMKTRATVNVPRIVGPFLQESLDLHGARDVHFACVWLIDFLAGNRHRGYRGPDSVPVEAPFGRALREMMSQSTELSGLLKLTPDGFDYNDDASEEVRRAAEGLVPADWGRDASV
jgi:hypothetical protein